MNRATALAWAGDGAAHLRGLMMRMGEDAFAAPSGLPGWSRGHVLTHVARGADAMINLLNWARTGERTPAYPSWEQRTADIEAGAGRPPAEIRDDVIASSDRLAQVARAMPEAAWAARVANSFGREIPASEVPWLRAKETWIHSVDLDVGASFADMPPPMVGELLTDVAATLSGRADTPALLLVAPDGTRWSVGSGEDLLTITGPAPELAAWLVGRSRGRDLRTDRGRRPPAAPHWL